MSFFSSRWCPAPAHVTELAADASLPAGFRAAGVAGGIKDGEQLDVGLLVCDSPGVVSAARFSDSGVLAAPVLLMQERCRLEAIRVMAVNSGNANAATGRPGIDEAVRVQGAAGFACGVEPDQVGVASTGVIGVLLPGDRVAGALSTARGQLRAEGAVDFAQAIRTTDTLEKHCALEVALPSGTVRLSAQCKGAGMISPRFATMLCFVQTDAQLEAATADLLLGVCVKRSFDRVSVDGQLSTNDTVVFQASGESGVRVAPESEDELRLGEALDAVLRQLAVLLVRDGEGARRVGRVVVRGGHADGVEAVARAIGDSPLVKTALFGGDPNWGRIAQAIGAALPGTAPLRFDIAIEGVQVCAGGTAVPFDEQALSAAVAGGEVEYEIGLPGEGAETEVFFSDLGHDYVKINAEYTT